MSQVRILVRAQDYLLGTKMKWFSNANNSEMESGCGTVRKTDGSPTRDHHSNPTNDKKFFVPAPMMKRLSLELGGKNAAIVFKDARLDKAIPTLLRAAFLNQVSALRSLRPISVTFKIASLNLTINRQ